jgi:threonine aldolase
MSHHSFKNDYSFLAHRRVLEALLRLQDEENIAYGLDIHSDNAKKLIQNTFGAKDSEVYFLTGGTQTNMVFISYVLKHYEGVIAVESGHINVHESAAVEGNGYKIITVKGNNGKVTAKEIEEVVHNYNDEHMVVPKMVYISNSTEIGSIYSLQELKDIYEVCQRISLYLFIDGARLASAITSSENDIPASLYGSLCDAFYVGGTKNGLLSGEALVINHPSLRVNFRNHIKNKGAMLAKGFVLGIQFEEVFKDGLYFELAKHANIMAEKVKEVLKEYPVTLYPSPTNQIFVSLNKRAALSLIEEFQLEKWSESDSEITVRFVTSFMTNENDISELKEFLDKLFK